MTLTREAQILIAADETAIPALHLITIHKSTIVNLLYSPQLISTNFPSSILIIYATLEAIHLKFNSSHYANGKLRRDSTQWKS